MTMILSAVVILAMCWALVKKYETRLVLIAGGLILACMAGDPLAPLVSFSKSMKQANVFEVIIASMGFAAVVKMTGLHTHLIAVFLKLLKKAGPFVIIGVSLATTIVNSAIPSAAGTSAAVGTIFIPLLLSAGVPAPLAAAAVMAGLYGGNLSPGHVHPTIVADLAQRPSIEFVQMVAGPILGSVVISSALMVLIAFYMKKRGWRPDEVKLEADGEGIPPDFKINYLYSIIPLLPLIILLLGNFGIVSALKMPVSHAMIIGAVVALVAVRPNPGTFVKTFFKGMGDSFGNIFGIIVAANIFVAGMKSVGLIQALIEFMSSSPVIAKGASIVGPFVIAVLCGSGEAASIAFNNAVSAHAPQFGLDIMNMGAMTVLSGGIGRSISPVAGAMIICAGIAKVSPMTVAKFQIIPMSGALIFVTLMLYVF